MASMSKRAAARTERELHDLLRSPGNSTCADCGARNPSWASWNLGVFLCMRCASIHRKLGTHISKVKSLSMDTWSNEQLESMKKNGNLAVNKLYNPKNKRPDMPLDADEVDGAMERFIRKKYQEKSLSDGRPEVPSRDEGPPPRSKSPDTPPPAAVPSKKTRFFGFGLRASSSAYPLSKHDKKGRNEPRVDGAFRISSENYTTATSNTGARAELSDHELQAKLTQLRDMGFSDTERNTNILKRLNGDLERTVEALVKLGPSQKSVQQRSTSRPAQPSNARVDSTFPAPERSSSSRATGASTNPFEQSGQTAGAGLSFNQPVEPRAEPVNTNPWQAAISNQPTTGLEQTFSNMQVAQPLFPHNTGGYPGQAQQYAVQTAAPAMPNLPQQYSLTSSPVSSNNPFMQAPLSAHSTGSNPYAAHMQGMPGFAPSTNPFMNMSPASAPATAQQPSSPGFNPFGLPPPPQVQPQPTQQPQQSFYDSQYNNTQPTTPSQSYGYVQHDIQPPMASGAGMQSSLAFVNSQYGQPQQIPQYQQQQPQQFATNPYQQQQPQTLMPQQTGRYDKNSILALYNYPQFAPAKPLASIPEPGDDPNQVPQQQISASPLASPGIYGGPNNVNSRRSATMPVSTMHSAGGTGGRNPFINSTNSSASSTPAISAQQLGAYPQGIRHASAESMSVNNPNLQQGRHSPDAFASLSARYVR